MFLLIYKIINIVTSPLIVLILAYRCIVNKEDRSRIKERFGYASEDRPKGHLIWIHAASVGEVMSVLCIIDHFNISTKKKILLTSGTKASAKIIKNKLSDVVIHQFVPVENFFAIKKFLSHWQPNIALFVESEFWPYLISETSKHCNVVSLNTRISDSSFKVWMIFKKLCKQVFSKISLFIPQSRNDFKRLKDLGAVNVKYIGNLKYSSKPLPYNNNITKHIYNKLIGRKILFFASTHSGEEEIISNIYNKCNDQDNSVLIIIAPRHPNRAASIKSLLEQKNYNVSLRSKREIISNKTDFYIVDTIGELGTFYRISPIVIMGGSFVNVGGHNPIEPGRLGASIIMGPYTDNFREISRDFKIANAAIFVNNEDECVRAIKALWHNKRSMAKYSNNAINLTNSKKNILPDTLECLSQFQELI